MRQRRRRRRAHRRRPRAGGELTDPVPRALQPALRLALSAGLDDPDLAVPPRLRRYDGFTRVSQRALRDVLRTLDDDPDFRAVARVAADEAGGDDAVGRAGWLLLDRPEGWEEELAAIVAADEAEATERADAKAEQKAQRQLAKVSRSLEQAEERLAVLRAEVAQERAARRDLEAALADSEARFDALSVDRDDAVRKLKDTEERLAHRTEEVRMLEEQADHGADEPSGQPEVEPRSGRRAERRTEHRLEHGDESEFEAEGEGEESVDVDARADAEPRPEPAAWGDVAAARALLGQAAEAAAALSGSLGALASLVPDEGDEGERVSADAPAPDPSTVDPSPAEGRRRRRRLRLPVGTYDDSPDAAAHLLRHPGVAVLVDGWNVSMAGWPGLTKRLQRERLVEALRDIEARTGARITVVFDSSLDERSFPGASPARSVQVRFAPVGVSADHELLSHVERLPAEQPVVVVSTDGEVRRGARERGANDLPAAALLALL